MNNELRKKVINLFIPLFIFLLSSFFISPVLAQQCTYAENCDPGTGNIGDGQHSCTGSIQDGTCSFDQDILLNCSECRPIETPSESPSESPNPSTQLPDHSSTPSNPTPKNPSIEEQAIYNLNNAENPTDQLSKPTQEDQSLLSKLGNIINQFKSFLSVFSFKPQNPPAVHSGGQTLEQNSLPEDLKPNTGDAVNDLKSDLGSSTGKYGITLPQEAQPSPSDSKIIKEYEQSYEKSNFPDGISPITGQK